MVVSGIIQCKQIISLQARKFILLFTMASGSDKVCFVCFKSLKESRDKKCIDCDICGEHRYHLACVGLRDLDVKYLEHLKFSCPVNVGCNQRHPVVKGSTKWRCNMCLKDNVAIKCAKCENDPCVTCAGVTEGMLMICNMMPKRNFLWCCFNCVDDSDDTGDDAPINDSNSSTVQGPANEVGVENIISERSPNAEIPLNRDTSGPNTDKCDSDTNAKLCRFYLRNVCKTRYVW